MPSRCLISFIIFINTMFLKLIQKSKSESIWIIVRFTIRIDQNNNIFLTFEKNFPKGIIPIIANNFKGIISRSKQRVL